MFFVAILLTLGSFGYMYFVFEVLLLTFVAPKVVFLGGSYCS